MPLKAVLDSLEGVEESMRALYVREGDKFRLDLEGAMPESDVQNLKKALEAERKRARDFEKNLKNFEGIDLEEMRRLKEESENREHEALKKKGDYEAMLQKHKDKAAKDIEEWQKKYQQLEGRYRNTLLTDRVRSAAVEAGVIAGHVDDVLLITQRHFDLDEEGSVIVKDEDNLPLRDMTPKAWFEKVFRERKPIFFAGSGASGGGAPGSSQHNHAPRGQVPPQGVRGVARMRHARGET